MALAVLCGCGPSTKSVDEEDGVDASSGDSGDGAATDTDTDTATPTGSTDGDDDDDFVPDCTCLPTDEPPPETYSAGGGTISAQVDGPGPWEGAPQASFEWTQPLEPFEGETYGMACTWGPDWGYTLYSLDFDFDEGRQHGFFFKIPEFTGAGDYEIGATSEGIARFDARFETEQIEDGRGYGASTEAGGSCIVTIDDLWWSGSMTCTGLLDDSFGDEPVEVGPVDFTLSWECFGRDAEQCRQAPCSQ